jgi:hypothetical protein
VINVAVEGEMRTLVTRPLSVTEAIIVRQARRFREPSSRNETAVPGCSGTAAHNPSCQLSCIRCDRCWFHA